MTAVEPQGTRILKGIGEPDPAIGDIGDYWFNSTNQDLYGPKAQEGWGVPMPMGGHAFANKFSIADPQHGSSIIYDASTNLWLDQPIRYTHIQSAASDVWVVSHNLGVYPAGISVIDSGDSVVYGNVQYIDLNTLNISFSAAFGGQAYLS